MTDVVYAPVNVVRPPGGGGARAREGEFTPGLRRLSTGRTADRRPVDKRRRLGLGELDKHDFPVSNSPPRAPTASLISCSSMTYVEFPASWGAHLLSNSHPSGEDGVFNPHSRPLPPPPGAWHGRDIVILSHLLGTYQSWQGSFCPLHSQTPLCHLSHEGNPQHLHLI